MGLDGLGELHWLAERHLLQEVPACILEVFSLCCSFSFPVVPLIL